MSTFEQLLFGNWHFWVSERLANVLLTVIAALCGAVVGTEREKKEKPTGTRTLALVSLGACVFTLLSAALGNRDGHIAASIISGIGFLGAGVIIHGRYGILGLTSAATIWAMAAIGMTVGAGYAGAGVGLSVLVLLLLGMVGRIERRYFGPCRYATIDVTFDPMGGKTFVRMEMLLDEFDSNGMSVRKLSEADGVATASIIYCSAHKHHRVLLARLAEMTEIYSVNKRA